MAARETVNAPGILNARPPLRPLEVISPSRYTGLTHCSLSEIWGASSNPILPSAPAGILGTLSHQLFERAARGLLKCETAQDAQAQWDALLAQEEEKLRHSWLTAHLVPLFNSIKDYEVKRIRACNHACSIANNYVSSASPAGTPDAYSGIEMRVTSSSKRVSGRIDRVLQTARGPVIIDFKTGTIVEETENGETAGLKPEYRTQLALYAALYAETKGEWPVQMRVVPMVGQTIDLDIDPEGSKAILAEAEQTLIRVNNIIQSHDPFVAETKLANPSPVNCKYCTVRPCCSSYRQSRPPTLDSGEWPADVVGKLAARTIAGLGRVALTIEPDQGQRTIIRGLTPNQKRHPALDVIQIGDTVGAYNLKVSGGSYTESNMTTLYRQDI